MTEAEEEENYSGAVRYEKNGAQGRVKKLSLPLPPICNYGSLKGKNLHRIKVAH
jgi:hypothetical protein